MAIDGVAPSTTTKRIAPSLSWNSTIAAGNHAIDGIVWRPVIIEPTAARSTGMRATGGADHGAEHDRDAEADERALQRAPRRLHQRAEFVEQGLEDGGRTAGG